MTWQEFREKYETEVAVGLAEGTQSRIASVFDAIEQHVNPQRVRDITSDRLSHYVKKLREKGLLDTTIASHLAHLQAALGFAVEWVHLAQIPKLPLACC